MSNEPKEFIRMEISGDKAEQCLQLVCEDGTSKVFRLKGFPWNGGGPTVTGSWTLEEIKEGIKKKD